MYQKIFLSIGTGYIFFSVKRSKVNLKHLEIYSKLKKNYTQSNNLIKNITYLRHFLKCSLKTKHINIK